MATSRRFQARNGLDNNSLTLIGVATPVNTTDAANKAYADTKLALTGGTLSGNLTIDGTAAAANTATVLTLRNTLDGGIGMNFTNSVSVPLASINALVTSSGAGTDDGILQFNTAVNGVNTERVRITAAGDVGIGMSSPDAKLRVNGTAKIGEGAASNTSKLMVNTVSGVAAGIQLFQDANESWIIQNPASTTALTFANSGTERMRIDASGNLGIGTSSPVAKLDVVGSLGIRVNEDAAGTKVIQIRSNFAGLGPSIQVSTADPLLFLTSNTERMRLDASGNLLVGTTTAAYATAGRGLVDVNGSSSALITLKTSDTARGYFGASTSVTELAANGASQPLVFTVNSAERMRIDTSGNVGIGTSSPSYKLDIRGSAVGSNFAAISVDNTAAGSGSPANTVSINFSNGGAVKDSITGAVYGDGYLAFATNNNTEKMRIDSAGNVGIGTVAPSVKLQVNGTSNGATLELLRLSNIGTGANTKSRLNFYAASTNYGSITGGFGASSPEMVFDINTTTGAFIWNSVSTERMRIDSAGNVGIGVTPSAWAGYKPLQAGTGASFGGYAGDVLSFVGSNTYNDNTNWRYIVSGNAAALYQQSAGVHAWYTAPSGTAGNSISFTQAMTLDASGNLLVGATSNPGILNTSVVVNSGANSLAGLVLQNNATGSTSTDGSHIAIVGTELRIVNLENAATIFSNNGSERVRITAAGDVGIGTSSPGFKLDVAGTVRTTGQLTSTVATGTAPFVIASTTRVANLNVATAGTADTLTTARNINEVSFNGSANITVPRIRAVDNRTASPAAFTTAYATVGFGSWNNDNAFPYADYIALRTYTDLSGGNDNMVSFRKDAIGMRVWQQTYGSATAFATFKDVAFTDSNITGSAASLTTTRTLWGQNFNGTANVTGSLTSVGDITGTGAVVLSSNNAQLSLQAPGASGTVVVGANSNNAIFVNSAGKVGIGAANLGGNPLEVAGNLLAYASVPGGVIVSGVWNSSSTANSNASFALYNDLPAGNFAGLQYFTSTNNSELRVANNGTNTEGTVAGEITFHNGIGANYVRRARINSTGEFVLHRVNTTSAGGMLRFQDISGSELYFIDVFGATASTSVMRSVKISTGDWQWVSNGLALRMSLTDSGALGVNATPSTTAGTIRASSLTGTGNRTVYSDANGTLTNTSSDATLKNNVQDIQYGLSSVLAMRPVSFNWIDEERFGSQTEIGFIAQEIQQIVPEVIGENSDQTLSLDYPKLIAVLTKAIQDQQAIIADITQRLTVLEGNT